MVDLYVILAPILLLAVVALLGFVGCATLAGIDDIAYVSAPTTPPPPNITQPLNPSAVVLCSTFTLTVTGDNLADGASLLFDGSDTGIKMNLTADGKSLTATITLTPDLIQPFDPAVGSKNVDVSVRETASSSGGGQPTGESNSKTLTINANKHIPLVPQAAPPSGDIKVDGLTFPVSQGWKWLPGGSNAYQYPSIRNLQDNTAHYFLIDKSGLLASLAMYFEPKGTIELHDDNVPAQSFSQPVGPNQKALFQIPWTKCSSKVYVTFLPPAGQPPSLTAYYQIVDQNDDPTLGPIIGSLTYYGP